MTDTTTAKRGGFRPFHYFGEVIGELKKVVWLTRREATYLTVLVLLVTIVAAIILGLIDFGFSGLVDKVFLGR
jgi:preprotein translocase SecE subunit